MHIMKRKYITIPAAILAAVIAVGWLAAPSVQAHNALATPSCSGLVWQATNYDKTVVNAITVKVDGAVVYADPDFKASDVGTVAWSQTANHTWSVAVNAPGIEFDRAFSGTWQACQTAPTTTVAPPTTTSMPISTTSTTTSMPIPTTTTVLETGTTTTFPVATTVPATCDTTGTVAACFPPVPPTTVAAPPSTVTDVSSLTPAEPPLPITGAGDTVLILACVLVGAGVIAYLVSKGRRVP